MRRHRQASTSKSSSKKSKIAEVIAGDVEEAVKSQSATSKSSEKKRQAHRNILQARSQRLEMPLSKQQLRKPRRHQEGSRAMRRVNRRQVHPR